MKSYQIVADNLEKLYDITGLKSARLCAIAKGLNLSLAQSTLSRLLNGGNTSIETLDSIAVAIQTLPGYEWVQQYHLLKPKAFEAGERVNKLDTETLKSHYCKLFVELDDIGWAKLNQKVSMDSIVDFSIHTFKKSGVNVEESSGANVSLRSGT